ncbi:MAG: hypothetical protein ACJ77K_17545 [Bacteroidia bacterium]
MKPSNPARILALALSISGILCYGQQNRSAVCRLGENVKDLSAAPAQALEVNLKKESKRFISTPVQSSINTLILVGDADRTDWQNIFKKIKLTPSIQSVVFESNTFESLPYGYEGLYTVSELTFRSNEKLDQNALVDQLKDLPNLRTLSTDLYTIFDLPEDLSGLKNLAALNLDKVEDENTASSLSEATPVSFDYLIEKADKNKIVVKYTAAAGKIDNNEYRELTRRFSASRDLDPSSVRFKPKYANVKPPIEGVDVEREVYTLNPAVDNVISYPSGTMIRIPANAFVDKDGNPVTSTVQINYREFRDPVDFLVSGIPMKYDTAGVTTNFESAGMFELTANVGNEAVQMAPDKMIDMNFQTTSRDSTYNFYSFNDQTGNWEYLQKPKTVTAKSLIKVNAPTAAYKKYMQYVRWGVRYTDTTAFNDRFSSKDYAYTSLRNSSGRKTVSYNTKDGWKVKSIYALVKIDKVIKQKDGTIQFHISTLDDAHPEMREFKDVYFQLTDAMSATEFKQKYFRKKFFSDIRLYASGNNIEIQLKDTAIRTLNATLVKINSKGKATVVDNPAGRIKRYNKRLAGRERNFARELNKKDGSYNYMGEVEIREPKAVSAYAYKDVKAMMTADEQKMTEQEFAAYCKSYEKQEELWNKQEKAEKIISLASAQANAGNLVESLQLQGLGIYNCDQIQRMQSPVEIFASYNSKRIPVNAKAAYVIDKKNNSVFQYDGFLGYSANKIAFDKSSKASSTLLAIGDDGSIAIYKPTDFIRDQDQLTNRKHFDFPVAKIDANFTSVGELKTLMGF